MRTAVLAVQGAFIEHERRMKELGAECFEIRHKRDLDQPFDGLILPGGESTVMRKLLHELDLLGTLLDRIRRECLFLERVPAFCFLRGMWRTRKVSCRVSRRWT